MAVAALFVQRLKRADNTITLAIEFHHVLYAILIQLPSEVLAHIDGSACVCHTTLPDIGIFRNLK